MSNQGPGDFVQGLSEVADAAKGAMDEGPEPTGDGPEPTGDGPKPSGEGAKSSGVGLQQLLLTILAPTLALIGIAIGILDSNSKEAAARKRDDQIRTAELVLPFYQDVITAQDAVDAAIAQCDTDFVAYFAAEIGSAEEAEAEEVLDVSCAKVTPTFDELEAKINQALLVSNTALVPVAEEYRRAHDEFAVHYTNEAVASAACFPPEDLTDPSGRDLSGADLDAKIDDLEMSYLEQYESSPVDSDEEASALLVLECIENARAIAFEAARSTLMDARAELTEVVQAQVLLD